MLAPRPYQSAALDALDAHVQTRPGNPCVVIPTGGGKSLLMAMAIQRWKEAAPHFRCMVLAHRKELVRQNHDEMKAIWPEADTGIYSAGLRRRDMEQDILFASIDSVWNKGGRFPRLDCIIVDEAHRIPAGGEGKYRTFLRAFPRAIVVGFTATPYRMGAGAICHKNHILHEICYEANVSDLIRDGYLCNLRSKIAKEQPDLSGVKRLSGGDYVVASLSQAVSEQGVVHAAVSNAAAILADEGRKSVVWFCVDVAHCHAVALELSAMGIRAEWVTAKTPATERDRIAAGFKTGTIQHILNVNVFTEGFNAKCIDAIVLLRPTLSKGLYAQMVGRGLRVHPNKTDCIILDYANCIAEHGPIDLPADCHVPTVVCGECREVFSRAAKVCPVCGWEYVAQKREERAEGDGAERRIHGRTASDLDILGGKQTIRPESVTVARHKKIGKPDSLKITYHAGLCHVSEWICLDHPGYAGQKAREWWRARFGLPVPTVDRAMADVFLPTKILGATETLVVGREGKYLSVLNCVLRMDKKEKTA